MREQGMTLVEVLVVLVLVAITVAISIPNLQTIRRKGDLERVARQVRSDLLRSRIAALTGRRNTALVFTEAGGRWSYRLHADGNGDGVLRRDILAGIDQPIGPTVRLDFLCSDAGIGVPSGWVVPDPSGRGTLAPGDGLKIGSARIVSFSPELGATPSSIYVHDATERMVVLRIHGGLGRVRVLQWRRGWEAWRELPL
jgi:prepilin-type N-terminal cleavage/methylation domain-containing protein